MHRTILYSISITLAFDIACKSWLQKYQCRRDGRSGSAHYNHPMALTTLPQARTWYVNSDVSFWNFTQELLGYAAKMKVVIERGDRGSGAVKFADLLLRAIELWKAGCVEELTGYAVENQPDEIWDVFRNAISFMNSKNDTSALLAIMELTGFGASVQWDSRQQPAKRATAVLRMFNPNKWGVVDWGNSGGEGGILLPPLPASPDEHYTFTIIPCV
jgi:hypothetical protein